MGRFCSAYGCSNGGRNKKDGVSLHSFPLKRPTVLKAWVKRLRREGFKPSINSALCSEHFNEEDFEYQPFTGRRLVKKDAVPSRFSFSTPQRARKPTSYEFAESVSVQVQEREPSHKSVSVQTDLTIEDIVSLVKRVKDQEELLWTLQQKSMERVFSFANVTDSLVKDLTGFPREVVVNLIAFYKLEEALQSKTKPCSLSYDNQFFLTLIRLRHGLSSTVLSAIYNLNKCVVLNIFNKCISVLYSKSISISIWPSREQVNAFMPPYFSKFYPSCRIILDATEFFIQKPGNPTKQQASFSHYKNFNTIKSLIGITPSGAISFISDLWLGSISDKQLTLNSGILDLLEEGDVVLAFLKDKIQFPLHERSSNKILSSHRCHVERAIGRIKAFKILDGVIPNTLKFVEEIYYVCAFLCNFMETPLIDVSTLVKENT